MNLTRYVINKKNIKGFPQLENYIIFFNIWCKKLSIKIQKSIMKIKNNKF